MSGAAEELLMLMYRSPTQGCTGRAVEQRFTETDPSVSTLMS
jgi:hypothetical protein